MICSQIATYRLDGENASLSSKIILANVDAYSTDINDDDRTGYILDWKYSDKFDVNSFLKA